MAAFLVAALAVPGGVRRRRDDVRRRVRRGARRPHRAVPAREPRRAGAAALGDRAGGQHGARRRLCSSPARSRSGGARDALWAVALVLDMAGPYFFGAAGWQLVPDHFAERHGLIIIIALGESVVAIGVGAGVDAHRGGDRRRGARRVPRGRAVVDLLRRRLDRGRARALAEMPAGREQNELARDAYSYLHFPMVAGIVLAAFGLKTTLAHVDEPLHLVPAVALGGGVAPLPPRPRRVQAPDGRDLEHASASSPRCVLLALIPVVARGGRARRARRGHGAGRVADPLRDGAVRGGAGPRSGSHLHEHSD